jgi:hypothetical protein
MSSDSELLVEDEGAFLPEDAEQRLGQRLARPRPSRERPRFKSVSEFCGEYTPLAYVVEGIVRSGSLYTLTAKTGAGKTAFNVIVALAVESGRGDILGRDVTRGRVAYLACENPDDIRMRFMIAARQWGVDLSELADRIVILDRREKPEEVCAELKRLSEAEPFALVVVDTLAAFFDGQDFNDAVQAGNFMRGLRPITQIKGLPAVLVAAHPVKNADKDGLLPYGSGAILNEVDGNLTLWKAFDTGEVSLHWLGKLRGLEFLPAPFRIETASSPDVLDVKGAEVVLPVMLPSSTLSADEREEAEHDTSRRLLQAMVDSPAASQRAWAATIGKSVSIVSRRLQILKREKLVKETLGKWAVTPAGKAVLNGD